MRIAIDVGGTFTDLAWEREGTIQTGKVLTTYPDPSLGVFRGLDELIGGQLQDVSGVIHATTLASNTAIERNGAKTVVLTTAGFRDVLLVGRQKRYDIYDMSIRRPTPLVPRRRILEVAERVAADGSIVRRVEPDAIRALGKTLGSDGVEAVAVCLLNAYVNPAHERQIVDLMREAAPSLYVTSSAEVAPQWREYERFTTTVLNAYLGPVLARYLGALIDGLSRRRFSGRLLVMQSSGGVAPADVMVSHPVRLLESGPAAGVLMTGQLSTRQGLRNVLSFDMGGTTAKLGLVQDGVVNVTDAFEIGRVDLKPRSGLPVMIPSVDIVEIGAGGGSIARPIRGLIEVGPRSAGADPGPACYGRGGPEPTVTDADLVLGYLNPTYFAGGSFALDLEAARRTISKRLAEPLGIDVVEAAWSIHRIVNINMATAAKAASIARGIDVRDYVLVGFGGAGPVHAARVAEELAIRRLLIPPRAGVGSAVGLLGADARFDLVRTMRRPINREAVGAIQEVYADLREQAEKLLGSLQEDGTIIYRRSADLRYVGQGFEVRTQIPDAEIGPREIEAIEEAFHQTYERIYGNASRGQAVEGTHWRLAAVRPARRNGTAGGSKGGSPAPARSRQAYFPEQGGFAPCPVYTRYAFPTALTATGPAIIEEDDCTTIIPPGWSFAVDEWENLVLSYAR
jgi:N-methylhydantoinase A